MNFGSPASRRVESGWPEQTGANTANIISRDLAGLIHRKLNRGNDLEIY